jgi:hypothetical protein
VSEAVSQSVSESIILTSALVPTVDLVLSLVMLLWNRLLSSSIVLPIMAVPEGH